MCGAEEEFASHCCWHGIDERRYKGILKAASLFKCHLNIDSVSLESEDANQSAKILHANGQLHDITCFQVYNALAIKVTGLI